MPGPSTLAVSLSRCCSPYTLKYSSLRDPSAEGTMPGPSTLAVSLSTCSSPYAAANSSRLAAICPGHELWADAAAGALACPRACACARPRRLRARRSTAAAARRPSPERHHHSPRPALSIGTTPSSRARGAVVARAGPPRGNWHNSPPLPFRPPAFPDRQPADCISDGSSELIRMD